MATTTAEAAFGSTSRALKIHPRWLQQILEGTKRIEIRNRPCPHEGWISLAATGILEIQGRALISGSRRLTAAEREEYAGALEVGLARGAEGIYHVAAVIASYERFKHPCP